MILYSLMTSLNYRYELINLLFTSALCFFSSNVIAERVEEQPPIQTLEINKLCQEIGNKLDCTIVADYARQ